MTSKYQLNKGYILQKLGLKIIIFDNQKSKFYAFNETAAIIIEKLLKGVSIEKLKGLLIKNYGISEERANKDLTETITTLVDKNILKKKS